MKTVFRIDLKNDELHDKMGGGVPKNSLMLVEGKDGMGKSILSQRIIYGAVKNEQKVTVISSELTVPAFMNQMKSLNYDIKQAFIKKELKFISLYPSISHVSFKDNLIDEVLKEEKLLESDIIVIDRLGEFLLKKDLTLKDCYEYMSLFNKITSMGKTIIFCINPEDIDPKFHKILRSGANVYMVVDEKDLYGNKLQLIRILRYSGAASEVEREIPFKVRAGIGIVPELTS